VGKRRGEETEGRIKRYNAVYLIEQLYMIFH
jgi:hypothetical protein